MGMWAPWAPRIFGGDETQEELVGASAMAGAVKHHLRASESLTMGRVNAAPVTEAEVDGTERQVCRCRANKAFDAMCSATPAGASVPTLSALLAPAGMAIHGW